MQRLKDLISKEKHRKIIVLLIGGEINRLKGAIYRKRQKKFEIIKRNRKWKQQKSDY
jgi:hypothetical protein